MHNSSLGLWECQEHMALCQAYLSAGFSSFKKKGPVPESSATRKKVPEGLEVQSGRVGGNLEVISLHPPFTEKKTEAQSGSEVLQTAQWPLKPSTSAQTLVWKMGLDLAPLPTCCVVLGN